MAPLRVMMPLFVIGEIVVRTSVDILKFCICVAVILVKMVLEQEYLEAFENGELSVESRHFMGAIRTCRSPRVRGR